jgi:hypothetical protein
LMQRVEPSSPTCQSCWCGRLSGGRLGVWLLYGA